MNSPCVVQQPASNRHNLPARTELAQGSAVWSTPSRAYQHPQQIATDSSCSQVVHRAGEQSYLIIYVGPEASLGL